MCCFWVRCWASIATLALLLAQTVAVSADEAEYLDVWSRGYSRFEIDDGDVVAFFTSGVEFDYLAFHASAQELRYNHATKAATASGDVLLQLDGSSASCTLLELDGWKGTAALSGGVTVVVPADALLAPNTLTADEEVVVPPSGTTNTVPAWQGPLNLSCDSVLLSFPPDSMDSSSVDVSLRDIDAQFFGPVVIIDEGGRSFRCAAASFDHDRMEVNVPGSFEFQGGPQPLMGSVAADLTAEAEVIGSGLSLRVEPERGVSEIRCSGMEITTSSLHARLVNIHATDVTSPDSILRWQQYDAFTSSVSGVLQDESQPPTTFSAIGLTVHADADGTATASMTGSVAVDSAAGEFRADGLEVTLLADGTLLLNQPFDAAFNLAFMSAMEPMSLLSAGSSEP